jgi:hypothetical protein
MKAVRGSWATWLQRNVGWKSGVLVRQLSPGVMGVRPNSRGRGSANGSESGKLKRSSPNLALKGGNGSASKRSIENGGI